MASVGNVVFSEEDSSSYFEVIRVIDDSPHDHPQQQENQLINLVKIAPHELNSSVLHAEGDEIFIRFRRRKNKQLDNKTSAQIPAGVSVPYSNKFPTQRLKFKSESESKSMLTSDDAEDSDSQIKVKLDLEKEILNLRAEVENVLKKEGQAQSQFEEIGHFKSYGAENANEQIKAKFKSGEGGKNRSGFGKNTKNDDKETVEKLGKKIDRVKKMLVVLIFSFWLVFVVAYVKNEKVKKKMEKNNQDIQKIIKDSLKENIQNIVKESIQEHLDSLKESLKASAEEVLKGNLAKVKETINVNMRKSIRKSIYLYKDKNYKGPVHIVFPWELNKNTCYNLEGTRNDFASSIDTQGECVYVFEHSDCRGKNRKLLQKRIIITTFDIGVWIGKFHRSRPATNTKILWFCSFVYRRKVF